MCPGLRPKATDYPRPPASGLLHYRSAKEWHQRTLLIPAPWPDIARAPEVQGYLQRLRHGVSGSGFWSVGSLHNFLYGHFILPEFRRSQSTSVRIRPFDVLTHSFELYASIASSANYTCSMQRYNASVRNHLALITAQPRIFNVVQDGGDSVFG